MVSTVFLDKILRPIDRALGVEELPLTIYLIFVFGVTFILTLNNKNTGLRMPTLVLAILTIFVFESKHIINGIEEREVTSDMMNIVINGYFK
jgi:hypothetical protein